MQFFNFIWMTHQAWETLRFWLVLFELGSIFTSGLGSPIVRSISLAFSIFSWKTGVVLYFFKELLILTIGILLSFNSCIVSFPNFS